MAMISKSARIKEYAYPAVNMEMHLRDMMERLSDFERKDVVNRIWHKDHTVWKPYPNEISNRLGWLQVMDRMDDRLKDLEGFAGEIQKAGYRYVILLGMGGSSLGSEVLRQSLGNGPAYPQLMVLDSTASAWVEEVAKSIELRHTLFLVSSKSGNTTETLAFYQYFRNLVDREIGKSQAGLNFIAITDAGTSLERLADDEGFRRTFTNPADIGGRYSVLSYFGLVPAALAGMDISTLIKRAVKMQENCAPCVKIYENPGVWLGALIGTMALHGHDKLTFIISPSVRGFGLWVEQLLAESTGKDGKGIVPIIDEPLVDQKYYGDDRLFVYLRMKGDENTQADKAVMRLEVAGHPVIQLEMEDQYDLGAEFFRWEMATAIAGIVLGINPFDQPDVQAAKDATKRVLEEFKISHRLPLIQSRDNLKEWLGEAGPDNYLAIMAYIKRKPVVDRALQELRKMILEKYHLATTFGYGPRYLHSTGQLHKGGPDTGMYLQIVDKRNRDLPVPGQDYTFNVLTEAEAQGDFRALESKGRKIARVQLCSVNAVEIRKLAQELGL
jgi:glucose-6-phosphate isomerase